jgi:hypothetical protein
VLADDGVDAAAAAAAGCGVNGGFW